MFSLPLIIEGHVTKCMPRTALKLIPFGQLTFDEMLVVHRVECVNRRGSLDELGAPPPPQIARIPRPPPISCSDRRTVSPGTNVVVSRLNSGLSVLFNALSQ